MRQLKQTLLVALLATFGCVNYVEALGQGKEQAFEYLQEGKIVTYASFSPSRHIESYTKHHILKVDMDMARLNGYVVIEKHNYDAHGAKISDFPSYTDTTYIKNGDVITSQAAMFKAMMSAGMDMSGIDIKITESKDVMPYKLSVGDQIEDYSLNIKVSIMKAKILLSDRKVEKKEIIRTPAGKFECYAISSMMKSKALMMSETNYAKEWYSRGYGLVRSENYDKKMKMTSFSLLYSIEDYISEEQLIGNPPCEDTSSCGHQH